MAEAPHAPDTGEAASTRWAAFSQPGFASYWVALLLVGFAVQIQTVAIGWQIYDATRDPFDLGLVGLSQFAPAILLVLVTGTVADRFARRRIIGVCLAVQALCAVGLLLIVRNGTPAVWPIFALLAVFGTARAFYNPARSSLLPNIVAPRYLGNAVASSATVGQFATITGPVAGGLLYGFYPELAYGVTVALLLGAAALFLSIPQPAQRLSKGQTNWATLSAGFRYIWSEKIVLGAISLDLFAVLLGGAMALLPVYARDVLDIGPLGLGMLRAGPAVGAIVVGVYLMMRPIRDHAGHMMFGAVACFGVFTLVFALSETVWLSVAALVIMGGADMVSISIRATLIQLWTPDALRGRVNAVNQVFVGASNEMGAFRAGGFAALMGPVTAVFVGGVGTLAVVGLWMRWFPGLRNIRQLDR